MNAVDVVTFGESLVLLQPLQDGALAHAPLFTRSLAGAESNVALALRRLGRSVRWVSRLGADPFGDVIASTLAGAGVDVSLVARDATAPTAVFFREIKSYGDPHVYYYRRDSAASRLQASDVAPAWFEGARLLHVTGITPALGPGPLAATRRAMEIAREHGIPVVFDPNLRRKLWDESTARATLLSLVPLCDIILPGQDEAEFLVGAGEPAQLATRLQEMGPGLAVLKMGAAGATAYTRADVVAAPPYPVERVVDTIGAGDAFAAGFLSVLLEAPGEVALSPDPAVLRAALERANLMGALATQYRGDWEGLPTLDEVNRLQAGRGAVTR